MAITATVARFEGEVVVLLIGEQELRVPCSELPQGIEQSDILKVELFLSRKTQAGAWRGEVQRGRQG